MKTKALLIFLKGKNQNLLNSVFVSFANILCDFLYSPININIYNFICLDQK